LPPFSFLCAERDQEPVTALVHRLGGEIESLLEAFRLSSREAEEILRDSLHLIAYRWEALESRELFVLATLKRVSLRRILRRAVQRVY
jgi:hypothetical protein